MSDQTIKKTNIQKELDNNPYTKAIKEDVLRYFENRQLAEPATIKDLVAVCQYFGEVLGKCLQFQNLQTKINNNNIELIKMLSAIDDGLIKKKG